MTKVNDYEKFAAKIQKELISGDRWPHRYVEKPMMEKLLPNIKGKSVLLLGCGTGEESVMLKKYGAKEISGTDISKKSIQLAKQTYPEHKFLVGDMHKIAFKNERFDFVYSSLAVHYSKNPIIVYKEVNRVLKKGGKFLVSVGHPLRWASKEVIIDGIPMKVMGFSNDPKKSKLIGNYSTFKEHTQHFPNGEVIKFWVGSPSFHFNLLKESGFSVEEFVESQVIDECKKVNIIYYQRGHEFPQFMAFLAKK